MLWERPGLYTDLYELAMAGAYFREGLAEVPATFDYSFRRIPFRGGFAVFAGLEDFLDYLDALRFDAGDIRYLASLGLAPDFLEALGKLRFRGTVRAVREGEVVFPLEPVVRVEGPLLEAQIIETALLNILNFESLIATKAARMRLAAGPKGVSEFGLRRAHGPGGILASRAAVVGGCDSTSNVLAARLYGLKAVGTMAHSFVEAHDDELEAFREFAAAHPDDCVLLLDTFDTLGSGVPNAIRVAKEMRARGRSLAGVRLDSGDLAYLAKHTRAMLDAAGLGDVRIVASNMLDEHLIKSLLEQGAPIDVFGVGTRLATGAPDGALDGIYKLAEVGGRPRLKVSESLAKSSLPGRKSIIRLLSPEGVFQGDAIALDEEAGMDRIIHPFEPGRSFPLDGLAREPLLSTVLECGRRTFPARNLDEISSYARRRLEAVPAEHKRFENPHIYKVGLSPGLAALRDRLLRELRQEA
jgi:nicotinate phosphoribosyltransferase